jgi:beta-glucosidase
MARRFTRRDFGLTGTAAGALAATSLGGSTAQAQGVAKENYYQYPKGFVWGTATASYQVEGAAGEDGRLPSVWDVFARTPGKVTNGDTGDVADDSYHRYKEDVQLMKWLGVKASRFSVAWPRVFPNGTGKPNEKGIAYYERLADELLKAGVTPYATLFHWDLPQAQEDACGGWQSKDTSKAFADYAGFVTQRLSDRVKNFFTINEFSCFTDEGYGSGTKAPGKKIGAAGLNQVRHNALLGHGMAVKAMRAVAKPGTRIGLAENSSICVPIIEAAPHLEAARKAMRAVNAHFLTAILEGKYIDSYLASIGAGAPKFTPEEMKMIGSPLDFIGLNIYTPTYVRADDSPAGFAVVQNPASYPHMASPWLTIGPEIAYWAPRHMGEIWNVKDVYITENGTSSDDVLTANGQVYDTDRIMYVRNHLIHGNRAVKEGWPLKGYFWWSLLDNFEWSDGYTKRFGMFYVDFKTQKRTAKTSAHFYKEVIARNSVL